MNETSIWEIFKLVTRVIITARETWALLALYWILIAILNYVGYRIIERKVRGSREG